MYKGLFGKIFGKRKPQNDLDPRQKNQSGISIYGEAEARIGRDYLGFGRRKAKVKTKGEVITWGETERLGELAIGHGGEALSQTLDRNTVGAILIYSKDLEGRYALKIEEKKLKQEIERGKTVKYLAKLQLKDTGMKAKAIENYSKYQAIVSENNLKAAEAEKYARLELLKTLRELNNPNNPQLRR
jgi:hypothetical protein